MVSRAAGARDKEDALIDTGTKTHPGHRKVTRDNRADETRAKGDASVCAHDCLCVFV